MSEYSRPLGDTVKKARKKMGLTQNQVASIIGADERTIMNIETYKANTTMEVLYPLIRTLHIDARDIFNPEIRKDAPSHHQLRVLIDSCSEEEAETLISVCEAVLSGLRAQNSIKIEEKACLPVIGKQALRFSSGSFAHRHFQFHNIDKRFLFAFGAKKRKIDHHRVFVYLRAGFTTTNRAGDP